jgi:hypothetical protein
MYSSQTTVLIDLKSTRYDIDQFQSAQADCRVNVAKVLESSLLKVRHLLASDCVS